MPIAFWIAASTKFFGDWILLKKIIQVQLKFAFQIYTLLKVVTILVQFPMGIQGAGEPPPPPPPPPPQKKIK